MNAVHMGSLNTIMAWHNCPVKLQLTLTIAGDNFKSCHFQQDNGFSMIIDMGSVVTCESTWCNSTLSIQLSLTVASDNF